LVVFQYGDKRRQVFFVGNQARNPAQLLFIAHAFVDHVAYKFFLAAFAPKFIRMSTKILYRKRLFIFMQRMKLLASLLPIFFPCLIERRIADNEVKIIVFTQDTLEDLLPVFL